MNKNKTSSFAICILMMLFTSVLADSPNCIDFLQELNLKPAELKYQSCIKVDETPAVLFKASYEVSGEKAKDIENFLHKEFGLKRLSFACCGWETSPVTYKSPSGETYKIHMHSLDEFDYQETWGNYKAFRIIVGKYLVLP